MRHQARKRFGQHFLHDPGVIRRIIDSIDPQPGEVIVEIGPGQGAITIPLLDRHGAIVAVELDRDLIPILQDRAQEHGDLTIHSRDALDFDFCACRQGDAPLKVVGNLPYNVSTPLLFHLLGQKHCVSEMFFMLQKEVVERMVATPGNKRYGRLTVMLAAAADVKKLFNIGSGAFKPPPAVDSAFCMIKPWASPPFPIGDQEKFALLVNTAFSARRKTLRNALAKFLTVQQIESLDIDPGLRPENLEPSQFAALARL